MRNFSGAWVRYSGDLWGGLAAMLVALPAAIAFGVTVYSTISPQYAAFGALTGALGAMALGLIAPTFGGTDRLISAPCAPAAAILSAFAIEMAHQGNEPTSIVLLVTVLGILGGLLQLLIGFLGIGRLIRYIPYPVVSGYMSAVGLIIIGSQLPKFAGAPMDTAWLEVIVNPQHWDWRGLVIGGATVFVTLSAGRFVRLIPSTIVGILAGMLVYAAIAVMDSSLRVLEGNGLVIGALGVTGDGYLGLITDRWSQIGTLQLSQIGGLVGSALTLAALLSIDTLKTCVVLDQLTRSRHDSNRELVAQGLANIVSSGVGGMPGAGTMGASMVNFSSGAKTRVSGIFEGLMTAVAALALGAFVAWIPVAALSGVLIVVGLRMIDTDPLRFLESTSTVIDFSVVLAVIGVALTVGLIAASATGVVLSVMLFLREQVGGVVLRRKSLVSERSSAWYRPVQEMRILETKGHSAIIFELQGSLFFGTSQQLYRLIEPEIQAISCLILDLQRVQSVDVTAAHTLNVIRDMLAEHRVPLILSTVRERLPNGRNLREFLELSGLEPDGKNVIYMPTLPAAIEWVEARVLIESGTLAVKEEETPLELHEIELFKGCAPDSLGDLKNCLENRSWHAGDTIFSSGEPGHELFLLRKGQVKLMGYIGRSTSLKHIATCGRGDFVGGLSFLDNQMHSNDAVAVTDCDMYVLTREKYNRLVEGNKPIAFVLLANLARMLAVRLRHANNELSILQDN